jgi:hypothetical protein
VSHLVFVVFDDPIWLVSHRFANVHVQQREEVAVRPEMTLRAMNQLTPHGEIEAGERSQLA